MSFLSRYRTHFLAIVGFFAVGFLIYGWSLHNSFVRWDDGMLIYENPAIRAINLSTLKWIFTHFDPELYIPLTFLSYQIDYLIGGIDPFQFHLSNLVLHILNALLAAAILFALIRRKWIALLCGLVFLVHPLNTEAVEWASGRKDVLSTFFGLASIVTYFFYLDKPTKKRWYITSVVLFLLGLLSKVMIVTFPVILMLLDIARGRKMDRAFFLDKIPYVALSAIFGAIGVLGKERLLTTSTLSDKILMAFKSMLFYIEQYVWPVRFSLLYPYNGSITLSSVDFFLPMILMVALFASAILLFNRYRLFSAGILFYGITVAPTLLNFSKGEMDLYFASDRYAYVPQIGLILSIAAIFIAVGEWLKRTFDARAVDRAGVIAGSVIILLLGLLAYRQSLVWTDTRTLFQNVIRLYPDASYVAYNNLCNADRLAGNMERAEEECEKSLEIRKNPKTYSNLGAIYRKKKDYAAAIKTYVEAIAFDAKSAYPHFGLGIVYAETGQYDKAEIEYLQANALKPDYRDVYINLGALYAIQGKYAQAVEQYEKALKIDSFHATALFNLAVAETELQKTDDAIRDYKRAIDAEPSMIAAQINLGLLLYNTGKIDQAIAQFRAVLAIDPDNASAKSALRQLGQE